MQEKLLCDLRKKVIHRFVDIDLGPGRVTVRKNLRSRENVHTAVTNHVTQPVPCIKFHVTIIILAIASTLTNCSDTSKCAPKNISVRWQSYIMKIYYVLTNRNHTANCLLAGDNHPIFSGLPCVGKLEGGYVHNVPLPRIPQIQSTSSVACAATLADERVSLTRG
jgi:hypothetical protein